MSVKPLVAVVGRPNVGKSTFFNKIAGQRIAIVEDIPGVTRDRVCADCEWLSHRCVYKCAIKRKSPWRWQTSSCFLWTGNKG